MPYKHFRHYFLQMNVFNIQWFNVLPYMSQARYPFSKNRSRKEGLRFIKV